MLRVVLPEKGQPGAAEVPPAGRRAGREPWAGEEQVQGPWGGREPSGPTDRGSVEGFIPRAQVIDEMQVVFTQLLWSNSCEGMRGKEVSPVQDLQTGSSEGGCDGAGVQT